MEAELRWAFHTAQTGKSFMCEDKVGDLFRVMFPDSTIAKKFSCGRTKQTYLINFAISPSCQKKIVESVSNRPYSIAFDETDGNMMVVVRYINPVKQEIVTEMLDFVPLEGNFSSENCTKAILSAIDNAQLRRINCISDFSDSCNAMRGGSLSYFF